ncbi:hypothetical protein [Rubrivivax rivuli]|uniref:MxaK protein n=1 Tax=Rubrivivax rivuli TaxID=1862385 RepID=A0A437R8P1_9BURK|nr:hypothetical protein [Rubrivivax rivuli]RVU43064.1 hypothetical protein EOE66_21455 [Rubrivivax rivuli]
MKTLTLVALLLHFALASASDLPNQRLSQLVAADQEVRRSGITPEGWAAAAKADAERRVEVLAMLKQGSIRTSLDYENAALIMQHGTQPNDYRLAHALATVAATLKPDSRFARWLQTATWDRLLHSLGKPQWYGTQKQRDPASGQFRELPNEPDISDEHRQNLNEPAVRRATRSPVPK